MKKGSYVAVAFEDSQWLDNVRAIPRERVCDRSFRSCADSWRTRKRKRDDQRQPNDFSAFHEEFLRTIN